MVKYDVSIIVPVYNVEKYLDDCLNSIIKQKYDFSKIEVILVNDGSKDNSLEICNRYSDKYENIIVYDKPNSGVSDTRNFGYSKSHGKYVMFLDSDDLINDVAIKYLTESLDKNKKIDFVISRVRMFEKTNKWHYLDYRFNGDRTTVDISKDIRFSQYHSTGILFRSSALKNVKFDTNIKYGEDMKFMTTLLLNNGVFGIEKRSVLFYRKRFDETSAVQKQAFDKDYYIKTLEDVYLYIIDSCKKKYKELTQYFQYYILNSLVERFEMDYPKGLLTAKELDRYSNTIKDIINQIDDEVITLQKRTGFDVKYYLLKLKHGKNGVNVDYKDNRIIVNGVKHKFRVSEFVRIFNIEKKKNKIYIYFTLNDYLFPNKVSAYINNKRVGYKQVDADFNKKRYCDIHFSTFYEEKVCMIEYDYKGIDTLCFKIDKEIIPYAISESFLSIYDAEKRYKRIGKTLIIFRYKKNDILFKKSLNIMRDFKYKHINNKRKKQDKKVSDVNKFKKK